MKNAQPKIMMITFFLENDAISSWMLCLKIEAKNEEKKQPRKVTFLIWNWCIVMLML